MPEIVNLLKEITKGRVTMAIRNVLEAKRKEILHAARNDKLRDIDLTGSYLVGKISSELARLNSPSLIKIINATGIIVHTNLGRSLLAREALGNLVEIGGSYSNLEFDLEAGKRGSRYSHVEGLLCQLSGAESALVVNNNAAAVLLALNTFCKGREVVVSRGELIEIGGSFRIPEIMEKSGAKLVEVGTTNRTHLRDYESAITEETALLLKVHFSNFQIVGFTCQVELKDLVRLGRGFNIPVMNDLGSGSFLDLSKYGLVKEPTVQEAIKSGADLATFSGDKLLGGAQAGIILGKKSCIDQIKTNPLNRALRIDKLTLATLESTLRLYFDEKEAIRSIPTLNMLTLSSEEINKRALKLSRILKRRVYSELEISIHEDNSKVGGGALPLQNLATRVVALKPKKLSIGALESSLRRNRPPIIGRIYNDELLLDVRTIQDNEFKAIGVALERIVAGSGP
jgi:L-seryl-tRNA(Ser) seleniumtransferase